MHESSADLAPSPHRGLNVTRSLSQATTIPGACCVPQCIIGKQPRPGHCRAPVFHRFFAQPCRSQDEQDRINILSGCGIRPVLQELAAELMTWAESIVDDELRQIARPQCQLVEKPERTASASDDWLSMRPTWHFEVAGGSGASESEPNTDMQVFVTPDMYRAYLTTQSVTPAVTAQRIQELRNEIVSVRPSGYADIVLDQMHLIQVNDTKRSRLKQGTTMAYDLIRSTRQILDTWLRYIRAGRLAGFTEFRVLEIDFTLSLQSMKLVQVEGCVHSSKQQVADRDFPYTFSHTLRSRHGCGQGASCCEVYLYSAKLETYFRGMLRTVCVDVALHFPQSSHDLVYSQGSRST